MYNDAVNMGAIKGARHESDGIPTKRGNPRNQPGDFQAIVPG